MGLFSDPPDYPLPESDGAHEPDASRTDALDAYGDRLIDDARRTGVRRRNGARKRPASQASKLAAAVTECLATLQDFVGVAVEVGQRLSPGVDSDAAVTVVGSADAESLVAVLVRDSLWTRLWPHIQRGPVFDALADQERRRFYALAEAASRRDKTLPRRLIDDPTLRRAIDIVAAHRVLTVAFGGAVNAVSPRRAFTELVTDPTAYEVLLILHNARTRWRTIAELPVLDARTGLPVLGRLNRPCYESAWPIAARIDPVTVLPYMNWCTNAWAALPDDIPPTRAGVAIGIWIYRGAWIQPANDEWFSVKDMGSRWSILRRSHHYPNTLGQVSQTLTLDGVDYAHTCPDMCSPPRMFHRTDRPETLSVELSWSLPRDPDRKTLRADYGALWTAGLVDMPLLTCPKEWS